VRLTFPALPQIPSEVSPWEIQDATYHPRLLLFPLAQRSEGKVQ
jgi:hypothetical protein